MRQYAVDRREPEKVHHARHGDTVLPAGYAIHAIKIENAGHVLLEQAGLFAVHAERVGHNLFL